MPSTDPAIFYFTQGVLGVTCIVLAIVVNKLWGELKVERAEKIEILKQWRQETKEEGKLVVDALKQSSQSQFYLADKIEVGKKANI